MTKRTQDLMRAAVIDRFGGSETLELRTLPVPKVGPTKVLIKVEVAGVGSWDAEEREGGYDGAFGLESTFPYILGWDGAGTVAAVGQEVTRFRGGERVYAASMPLPRGGFYAEFAVVGEDNVSHVPSKLTTEQAGVMPWDALTALSGLDELSLNQDDTVMILGASGGIGHLAIQFAKRRGVRVLAVASGEDGVALAKQLGADVALDGRRDDVLSVVRTFAPEGLDTALVTFGGEAAERALTAVREGGLVACPYGVPAPKTRPGVHLRLYNGDRSQKATDRLNRLTESGLLNVHVAHTFPLEQVQAAHEMLETHYLGKIALRLN
jgi:NADPH:quinone reductase